MSVDKLVDSTQLDADLLSVANAIRTKGGTSADLAFPAEFVSAIQAISGGGGITLAPMDYPVILQNGTSSTMSIVRVQYSSTILIAATSGNVAAGSTATYNNMLTDGTHFWFRSGTGKSVWYNDVRADFVYNSSYSGFMVTIPSGFDGTVPFEIKTVT